MKLDQFYTRHEVAKDCWDMMVPTVTKLSGAAAADLFFVEPSAGDGAFFNLMPADKRLGVDIEPRGDGIQERDFLRYPYLEPGHDRRLTVAVGNPPYGHRGKVAKEFMRVALYFADTIAFILPVSFNGFTMQTDIQSNLRLVLSHPLPAKSFRHPDGKAYAIQSAFQIWSVLSNQTDERHRSPQRMTHPDFKIYYVHSKRPQTFRHLDADFDFATPDKQYLCKNRRETDKAAMDSKLHWILLKAKNQVVLDRLLALDYHEVAMLDSTVFATLTKYKVVMAYERLYGDGETLPCMRQTKKPATRHPDFKLFTYRHWVAKTLTYHDIDFDFGIPQINRKNQDRLVQSKSKQLEKGSWILFKPVSQKVKNRLLAIDYATLAKLNKQSVPSITEPSIIAEYRRLYGDGDTLPDLRHKAKPLRHHPDFKLYNYKSCNKASGRYFDCDFDFAIPDVQLNKQDKRFTNTKEMDRKKNWIFLKANNGNILNRLLKINYNTLAKKECPKIPTVTKTRIINEYNRLYGDTKPLPDLRPRKRGYTMHPDFQMHYFQSVKKGVRQKSDYDFDFAIPRVMRGKATKVVSTKNRAPMEKGEWMLFTAATAKVRRRLLALDFNKIASQGNAVLPTVTMAKTVEEYRHRYE